jgi:hypothetical protein
MLGADMILLGSNFVEEKFAEGGMEEPDNGWFVFECYYGGQVHQRNFDQTRSRLKSPSNYVDTRLLGEQRKGQDLKRLLDVFDLREYVPIEGVEIGKGMLCHGSIYQSQVIDNFKPATGEIHR